MGLWRLFIYIDCIHIEKYNKKYNKKYNDQINEA